MLASLTRRITEAGFLLGAIGGLALAWGAWSFLRARDPAPDRIRERRATLAGGVLMAVGFLLALAGMLTAGR